jgi:hypothetical protein
MRNAAPVESSINTLAALYTEPSLKFCGGEARPEYAVAAITRLSKAGFQIT